MGGWDGMGGMGGGDWVGLGGWWAGWVDGWRIGEWVETRMEYGSGGVRCGGVGWEWSGAMGS